MDSRCVQRVAQRRGLAEGKGQEAADGEAGQEANWGWVGRLEATKGRTRRNMIWGHEKGWVGIEARWLTIVVWCRRHHNSTDIM
jgi:hypothetical protein